MKALTFEEWCDKAARDRDQLNMFTWARLGMIPEDEAVRIFVDLLFLTR